MSEDDRSPVRDWLTSAEVDWTAVDILMASERCPPETVCFHCQQYVEKLLKALLTLHGVEAPKTHDVRRLIQKAEGFAPGLLALSERADTLTAHAVQTRYPDHRREVSAEEMVQMVALAKEFARIVLPKLED